MNCKWCGLESKLKFIPRWGDMIWICPNVKWSSEDKFATPVPESCLEGSE